MTVRDDAQSIILIAFPGKEIKQIFYHDPQYVFFDEYGWWHLEDDGVRKMVKISIDDFSKISDIDIPDIRKKIQWWSPIWTRWCGSAEEYEVMRGRTVSLVAGIVYGLKKSCVKFAIFCTNAPHHYDSSVVSIACEVGEVRQIYLSTNVFDNELLPLSQLGGVKTRKTVGTKLRNKDYGILISAFIENKRNNKIPSTGIKLSWWKSSYAFAIFWLIVWRLRNNIQNLAKKIIFKDNKKQVWISLKDYNTLSFFKILSNQKKFLNRYLELQVSSIETNILTGSSVPALLIAAHSQPEATSFPEGGEYTNHVDIALTCRLKGYKGDLLYKEHFATANYVDKYIGLTRVGLYRSLDYIEDLSNIGCVFLSSSVRLSINQAQCKWYVPVTISGTIAIERSLAGLCTIVAGEPWFNGLPGVVRLSDIVSMEKIEDSWVIPQESIAVAAFNFLIDKLENRTIINVPGIGTGVADPNIKKYREFESQIRTLICDLQNREK